MPGVLRYVPLSSRWNSVKDLKEADQCFLSAGAIVSTGHSVGLGIFPMYELRTLL